MCSLLCHYVLKLCVELLFWLLVLFFIFSSQYSIPYDACVFSSITKSLVCFFFITKTFS